MDIIKGESYRVAFVLRDGNYVLTPEDVDEVRIALGNQIANYPTGTLTFDTEEKTWQFPMTQKNTYSFIGTTVDYQVQVKINDEVFSSKKTPIKIHESMFRKEW